MSNEVQAKIIADCNARIAELRDPKNGGPEKNHEEIQRLNEQITAALKGEADKNGGKIVESSTVDISSEMGATFKAKVKTADEELIEETKKHSGKYNAGGKDAANKEILDTYGYRDENGVLLSKDQANAKLDALNKQKKQLEKDLKSTQKAWEKASKSGAANADELEAKYDKLSEDYQKFKTQYDKDVAALRVNAGKKGAVKGIRKAADHNVKNYENVQEVSTKRAFRSKAVEKEYLKANPEEEGKTFHLEDNEFRALKQIQKYGKKQIDRAQKAFDENPGPESEKKLKDAQEKYGHYADMIDAEGNIDTQAVQNVLVDFTGGDQNLNLDEKKLLKKRLNVGDSNFVSEGDVKALNKRFGFGVENPYKTKWKAAGIAATAAGVGNALGALMGKTHSHQFASATDSKTVQGEAKTFVIEDVRPDGSVFKHNVTVQGGNATATATAVAEACAKIPVIGQIAGPVLAGVTAFIFTKGQTEDAFNGAAVEAVLEDLSLVKNADNQAIVNKIQDLQIDDRIKAAVLKASMGEGVTANTEELERVYHDLVKTKDIIDKIKVEEPEPPKPEPPKPEPTPEPDKYGVEKEEEKPSHENFNVIPGRTGRWYMAHAYVGPDGKPVSHAEANSISKALKGENGQHTVDVNGNGREDMKDKIALPRTITVNGIEYKLPEKEDGSIDVAAAEARIKKLPTSTKNPKKYTVKYGKDATGKTVWYVVNETKNQRVAGPYNDEATATAEAAKRQQKANDEVKK